MGVIDFYNLENISDENASNVTVTSSDEEDETIEGHSGILSLLYILDTQADNTYIYIYV